MKAIGVTGAYPDAPLSECFGKSEYFFLFDGVSGIQKFMANPRADDKEKSGKNTASILVKNGVDTVMSYNIGSHAKKVFDKNKIRIVILSGSFKTLKDVAVKMKIRIRNQ